MLLRLLTFAVPDLKRARMVTKLALPVMGAMLVQAFINLFDTIIVGYLPREYSIAGQAGLGYTMVLHWLVGGFASCIAVGTQAMTARRFGGRDIDGAGQVAMNAAVLALIIGGTFTIVSVALAAPIFRLVTSNEQVLAQGVPYARARFAGVLAMVGTLTFKAFFDGLGKTYYHLLVAVFMNIANVILDVLLVFGVGPFPRLNVLGAGVASCIASYLGFFMMIGFALKPRYRKGFRIFRWKNLDTRVALAILRLSLPSGVATLFVMTGFLLFYKWVDFLDSAAEAGLIRGDAESVAPWLQALMPIPLSRDAIAALLESHPPVFEAATKVIIDILSITFLTCMGLGIATATLVSQNLGKGRPDEAEKYGWTAVRLATYFCGTMGLLSLFAPETMIGLFSHDPEVIEAGRAPLRLMGSGQFLLGFGLVLAQALFGAGATRYVMKVEIALHTLCLVPLSYVLGVALDLKLLGLWASALIYIVCLALAMTWKFVGGTWKVIRI